MRPYFIANTPCGIYRGDLPLGYAFYQTLLDVHARFIAVLLGQEVRCHQYSLNVLGKRAEDLLLISNPSIAMLDEYTKNWASQCSLRETMGFSFEGNLFDTSTSSVHQARQVFLDLFDRKFLCRKGDAFFLDTAKIRRSIDIDRAVRDIRFFSQRGKREFTRIVIGTHCPVRITKRRQCAVPNPIGGEPIAPIFGIANIWESCFPIVDIVASSEKELARYVALRFFCRVALNTNALPMKSILTFNAIYPSNEIGRWNTEDFIGHDRFGVDSFRVVLSKALSLERSKIAIQMSDVLWAKHLTRLVESIHGFFLKRQSEIDISRSSFSGISDEYMRNMSFFRYSLVLNQLERELRKISRDIDFLRREEGFSKKNTRDLFERYISLVYRLTPFCPKICATVLERWC